MVEEKSLFVRSTGGSWSTLIEGPAIVTSIEISGGNTSSSVGLRFVRGSASAVIIPADLLPMASGSKIRVATIPLAAGDRLEVMSGASVDWSVGYVDVISARQFSTPLSSSGGSWKSIVTDAGRVDSLLMTNVGFGRATVSIRVSQGAGAFVLLPDEIIPDGGSRRKLSVATLAEGELLQVRSTGAVDWLATGVHAQ